MADRILFISWAEPVRGREERGLEVFNDALGFSGAGAVRGASRASMSSCSLTELDIGGYMELQRQPSEQLNTFERGH